MMQERWAKIQIGVGLAAGLIGLATAANAPDDTARFYGMWETRFPYNGQMLTGVSARRERIQELQHEQNVDQTTYVEDRESRHAVSKTKNRIVQMLIWFSFAVER